MGMCMPDRELKNLGNRSFVEYWLTFDTCVESGIQIVRWDDNSVFNLASTFGSGYPTVDIVRWLRDKAKKSHLTPYKMPGAIGQYNKSMGGIDKMDMLISLYQCKFKVRRWHMKIFFHYIDLYTFKRNISEVWIKNNSSTPPTTNTRGDSRRTYTIMSLNFTMVQLDHLVLFLHQLGLTL